MTDFAANGTDLTAVPWIARPGEGTIRAAGLAIGTMSTPELAEAVCAEHNAALLAGKAQATEGKRHAPREHLAWLMWCYEQGYTDPADRAILTNWIPDDGKRLTPRDIKTRRALLGMADEILALIQGDPAADGRPFL